MSTISTRITHLTVAENPATVVNGCDDDAERVGISAINNSIGGESEPDKNAGNGKKDRNGSNSPKLQSGIRSLQGSVRSITKVVQDKLSGLREEGNFTKGCMNLPRTRTRFLIMMLVLLCLASVWSNILSFNFAIICINADDRETARRDRDTSTTAVTMVLNAGSNETASSSPHPLATSIQSEQNSSTPAVPDGAEEGGTGDGSHTSKFTPHQRLLLTSAVAAAALIANFAVVSLVNHFGVRSVFSILGMLSAVATVMMPAAIGLGFNYTLAARVLQGVAFAANFPVIGAFTSKWTYYKQNGLFVSVLVAYVQFAPAVTMPVSGALCASSLGWPSVFFAHGAYCALLFTVFAMFYRNSPAKHPHVGEKEMRKIAMGKTELSKEILRQIPYREILKTASVWAVWIAAIGNFTCVNMMFLYSPDYLHGVLGFAVQHTGFSASLAPLAQFSIKLLAGFTSDKIRNISETNKLRLYNSIAFFGSALFLVALAFFPTEYTTACLMLLGVAAGLLGFTTGGFFKAGPLVSKHYSHFVTGNVSLGITLTMLFVPMMVTGLSPNNNAEGWRWVFLCTSGVMVLTNLLFVMMVSAKPAAWTTDEFSRNASRNKIYDVQHLSTISTVKATPEETFAA